MKIRQHSLLMEISGLPDAWGSTWEYLDLGEKVTAEGRRTWNEVLSDNYRKPSSAEEEMDSGQPSSHPFHQQPFLPALLLVGDCHLRW